MVKHTQKQTNCLSVFDHFVGLALKGLMVIVLNYYVIVLIDSNDWRQYLF